jgi:hypothetical protein
VTISNCHLDTGAAIFVAPPGDATMTDVAPPGDATMIDVALPGECNNGCAVYSDGFVPFLLKY